MKRGYKTTCAREFFTWTQTTEIVTHHVCSSKQVARDEIADWETRAYVGLTTRGKYREKGR